MPQALFCLLTAFQLHELTIQLPRQVWIAMPRDQSTHDAPQDVLEKAFIEKNEFEPEPLAANVDQLQLGLEPALN